MADIMYSRDPVNKHTVNFWYCDKFDLYEMQYT